MLLSDYTINMHRKCAGKPLYNEPLFYIISGSEKISTLFL